MCAPVAAIPLIIGGIMSVASAGIGAIAAVQSANAQNKAVAYNAQMKEYQAAQATQLGEIEAKQKRLEVSQLRGKQTASYAGGGVIVNQDSPLTVSEQTAGYGELDALAIKQKRAMEAWGYQSSAELDRASKINPVMAGASSFMGGMSGVGGSLLNFGLSRA